MLLKLKGGSQEKEVDILGIVIRHPFGLKLKKKLIEFYCGGHIRWFTTVEEVEAVAKILHGGNRYRIRSKGRKNVDLRKGLTMLETVTEALNWLITSCEEAEEWAMRDFFLICGS